MFKVSEEFFVSKPAPEGPVINKRFFEKKRMDLRYGLGELLVCYKSKSYDTVNEWHKTLFMQRRRCGN